MVSHQRNGQLPMKWQKRRKLMLRTAWQEAYRRAAIYAGYPDVDVSFYSDKIRSCCWLLLSDNGYLSRDIERVDLARMARRAMQHTLKSVRREQH